MGPFDVKRQLNRRRAVRKILANPDLPEAARDVWLRIYNNITLDEELYNRRVQAIYANHKQEIVEWT
jgi:hypothetical protein